MSGGEGEDLLKRDPASQQVGHDQPAAAGGDGVVQRFEAGGGGVEVEVDRLEQIPAVLDGGADIIMLDNFSLDELRAGVELIAGRAVVEASGGVSLETVGAIAATGVDVVSVGALTHSAPAVDLGLDISIESGAGGS